MTVHTQQVGAAPLPAPRLGNLNKLSVEDVVGACLVSSDAPDSHSKLKRKLEELLTDAEIRVALAALEAKGLLKPVTAGPERVQQGRRGVGRSERHPGLSADGQKEFGKRLGIDKPQP